MLAVKRYKITLCSIVLGLFHYFKVIKFTITSKSFRISAGKTVLKSIAKQTVTDVSTLKSICSNFTLAL